MASAKNRKPATEADVEQGHAVFWVPDLRSKTYDLGVPLPVEASVTSDIDVGKEQPIPAGAIVRIIQAEIVDDSEVLLGFTYLDGQAICTPDQIKLPSFSQQKTSRMGELKPQGIRSLVGIGAPDNAKKLALEILENAKTCLQREGYLTPRAFLLKGNDEALEYTLEFEGPEEKRSVYDRLINLARKDNALAIITVNDAYCEDRSNENSKEYYYGKLKAEQAPECIYVTISGPGITTWSVSVLYKRKGDYIVFEREIESRGDRLGLLQGWASSPSEYHQL